MRDESATKDPQLREIRSWQVSLATCGRPVAGQLATKDLSLNGASQSEACPPQGGGGSEEERCFYHGPEGVVPPGVGSEPKNNCFT